MTLREARAYVGVLKGGPKLPLKVHENVKIQNLPTNFDAREQWVGQSEYFFSAFIVINGAILAAMRYH